MIREILNNKIAEQRQDELEKQKKQLQQAEELKKALVKAEAELIQMIKSAPISLFNVPEDCKPLIVIIEPDIKAAYEKTYSVFIGYQDENSSIKVTDELGKFKLNLSYLFTKVYFDDFFAEDKPIIIKGTFSSDKNILVSSDLANTDSMSETIIFVF